MRVDCVPVVLGLEEGLRMWLTLGKQECQLVPVVACTTFQWDGPVPCYGQFLSLLCVVLSQSLRNVYNAKQNVQQVKVINSRILQMNF